MITITRTYDDDFRHRFDELLERGTLDIKHVSTIVSDIIAQIRNEGDTAVIAHIAKFDHWSPSAGADLAIPAETMERAYHALDDDLRNALHTAYERIKAFHEKQLPKSWLDFEKNGTMLGQKVTPVERAGLYIPGGKAAYPSSLLMNAIPAIVAGVEEIIVCTPTPNNEPNELLLAACYLCGIEKVFKVGGATAIAAMAYGTATIPAVDVITGPGNIFVATAKKMVFGDVNIDMIAGPSEIGILADESADPSLTAIDLLSQAEHDEMASSILITTSESLAQATAQKIEEWLAKLPREEIARKSIDERGMIIVATSMDEAVTLMNKIAPEHLEVVTASPFDILPKIKNAGAIFLGANTPEAIGDYVAGPNHTLPTGGTARFYSPLSVEHFMKKSSIIAFSRQALDDVGPDCAILAQTEGLSAHQLSVTERLKGK